jgi:hypothetical protein
MSQIQHQQQQLQPQLQDQHHEQHQTQPLLIAATLPLIYPDSNCVQSSASGMLLQQQPISTEPAAGQYQKPPQYGASWSLEADLWLDAHRSKLSVWAMF